MPETMEKTIDENFYQNLSKCVNARVQSFHKGEYIQTFNARKKEIGIVIEGEITLYKSDIDGNTLISEKITKDSIFSQAFMTTNEDDLFLIANENSQIIFIDYNYLLKGCNEQCIWHKLIVSKIFDLVIEYTSKINLKIDILTKKNIQDKLQTYFKYLQNKNNSKTFTLPISYKELALYIGVDRSAMMRKLKDLENEKQIKKNGRVITII